MVIAACFSVNLHAQNKPLVKGVTLTTFKNIPDDMMGCGDSYYLSKADMKAGLFLILDNSQDILLYLNNQPVKFKQIRGGNKKLGTYKYKDPSLSIKNTYYKQAGDEYYLLRALITLKQGNKIIWQKNVIGDGGC
jgi:hypothetical protein